jgi:hypothetical protein
MSPTKKIVAALGVATIMTISTAGIASAGPAMCVGHSDHGDWANGPAGDKYVTACGGGSGPDADGNNATAPHVSPEAS